MAEEETTEQARVQSERERRRAAVLKESPAIWRCKLCGGLIHPADERTPLSWCSRCGRVTEGVRDGA